MQTINYLLKNTNSFIFKPLFFEDIQKRDGFIAWSVAGVYLVTTATLVTLFEKYEIFIMSGLFFTLFSAILILLNFKKIHTLGIRKKNIKAMLITLLLLLFFAFLINLEQIRSNEINVYDFIYNATVYLLFIGFFEEFFFRGFLWPRFVVLHGKHKGSIICGVFFGLFHLITDIKYGYGSLNFLHMFNTIWSGVIGQYLFMLLYSFLENSLFSAVIHAAPHFVTIDRTLKGLIETLHSIF